MKRMIFSWAAWSAVGLLASAIGCSAPDPDEPGGGGPSGGDGDGDGGIVVPGDGGDGDGTVPGGEGEREVECTINEEGVEVCVCIKLATWGALGTFGAVPGQDGQDAIAAWLNENSTGEAEYFAAKPLITLDALSQYDVILIQDISAWSFTPEEVTAFQTWVSQGGGVISLAGYSANGLEMGTVNTLLQFSGLQYIPNVDTVGNGYDSCQYCFGSSAPMGGWDMNHPISANINDVGAYFGRPIALDSAVNASVEVVAETPEGVLAAAAGVEGGRVFMFHDEWVTYNSQWTGTGLANDCRTGPEGSDPNNACHMRHPVNDYSSAQFWFNSIRWVSGEPACFIIDDETIVR